MSGTGLLTERCNPYGTEGDGSVQLAGGLYPASMMGNKIWYCGSRAAGVYRMTCTGGEYGFRRANDSGPVPAFHCAGGHQGQPMPLCDAHAEEFSARMYQAAKVLARPWHDGEGHEQWWNPRDRVGGPRANEMCPACLTGRGTPWHERIRDRMETADALQAELSRYQVMPVALLSRIAELERQLNAVRGDLDELHERGIIHKCPLKLVEVS